MITLPNHILELEFIGENTPKQELINKAKRRVQELAERARQIKIQFTKASMAIQRKEDLDRVLDILSSRRDLIQQRP